MSLIGENTSKTVLKDTIDLKTEDDYLKLSEEEKSKITRILIIY